MQHKDDMEFNAEMREVKNEILKDIALTGMVGILIICLIVGIAVFVMSL